MPLSPGPLPSALGYMVPINDAGYRDARAAYKAQWKAINAPCSICGHNDIDWDGPRNEPDSFELDHVKSRKKHPDLAMDPNNWAPAHSRCNRAKSDSTVTYGLGTTSEAW